MSRFEIGFYPTNWRFICCFRVFECACELDFGAFLSGNEITRVFLISGCGTSSPNSTSAFYLSLFELSCVLNTHCSFRSLATFAFANGKKTASHPIFRTLVMASTTTTFITATSAYLHVRAQTTIPPEVIGYTSTFGVYSAWNCLTGTWYEVSGFGRCCPTTQGDCPVYTTCLGNIVSNDQFHYKCTGSFKQTECITGTVYKSIGG